MPFRHAWTRNTRGASLKLIAQLGNSPLTLQIDFGFGDKLAPRLGFAYDINGDGRWKAYGSWGYFYDIMKLELPRGAFGGDKWLQYERIFPALAASSIDQVSLECQHSHVPPELMGLLRGKDVMVGVIDVASDVIETPEEVAETIGRALQFVAHERLIPCTNCGMAPMDREVAQAKLSALARGAELARTRFG